MAITTSPYWNLSLTFKDLDTNTSQMQFLLPDTVVLDDVVAAIDGAFGALVSPLSDAVLVGYSLSRGGTDYAAPDAAETSDVERKGVFTFKADNGQVLRVSVPSIKNSLVINKTNIINTGDTAVAAFIAFITGGILGVGQPVTNGGGSAAQLLKAEKTHVQSSKG
jgi:hypothetical protein